MSGPLHHRRCRSAFLVSTMRNQWLQCGGSLSEPSRPRVTGWRLPRSVSRGRKPAFGDVAARLGRQDGVERRAPDAGRARVIRPGRDQHRAAVAHIARDVVEIDDRQHALARVAVEDDELEFVDLLLEQFARREGDQRQFVDRRAVLLFRRPQNGEMHEIDRGVGLEQVAPGALAGMRLAGDQQHAQLVAHAVDRDHGAIVDLRELAGRSGAASISTIFGPPCGIGIVDVLRRADRNDALFDDVAVAPHRDLRGRSRWRPDPRRGR